MYILCKYVYKKLLLNLVNVALFSLKETKYPKEIYGKTESSPIFSLFILIQGLLLKDST